MPQDHETRRVYENKYRREHLQDPGYHAHRLATSRRWQDKHREEVNAKRRAARKALRADPVKHEALKAQLRAAYQRQKETRAANAKRYRAAHRDAFLAHQRAHHAALRDAALRAYGGYLCACCGETLPQFLCIDHINGGGAAHHKQVGLGSMFYNWLKKQGYPPGYQVLCYNCNQAKGQNGECPHKRMAP